MPISDRDKEAEILALRHQLAVLQRQTDKRKLTWPDRALLAALLHRLPRVRLRQLPLIVSPDTVLRWHRELLCRRHAKASRPKRPGRPRTVRSVRALVLRLARENPSWGYRRIHGELASLGIKVAAATVWNILKEHGIDPAPERDHTTWTAFLHSQAQAILAADFFETKTLNGATLYVLAVIEHATRRVRILGATANPTAVWITQLARNMVMGLQAAGINAKFLIRDRDGRYPASFDTVLQAEGVKVVQTGVRMPLDPEEFPTNAGTRPSPGDTGFQLGAGTIWTQLAHTYPQATNPLAGLARCSVWSGAVGRSASHPRRREPARLARTA
ncbi:helix-turn-helix domain-containing protein [Stenotrophomonas sp. NPDC087984]